MFGRVRATAISRLLLGMLVTLSAQTVFGQDGSATSMTRPRRASKATSVRNIPAGARIEVTGNVTRVETNSLSVCDTTGAETVVLITDSTSIRNDPSGIFGVFQQATVRQPSELSVGLLVKIEGRGNDAGQLVARRVRFRKSDFRAQSEIDTRAIPIEVEQDRMANQLDETSLVAIAAKKDARVAQESADKAQTTADDAKGEATLAQANAVLANKKIATIDDYAETEVLDVFFKTDSAVLSDGARSMLDDFAAKTANARGYILEISGYTDDTGTSDYNHRLSQRRAEAVMDYLVGVRSVPLRRIVNTFSGGEMNPVADNTTKDGRALNRRVSVKMLVSNVLAAKEQVAQSDK